MLSRLQPFNHPHKPYMNEEIKIDKGIAITPIGNKRGGWTNAFRTMDVGDSFVVPDFTTAAIASCCARQAGFRASWRKQQDGSYRIWRKA